MPPYLKFLSLSNARGAALPLAILLLVCVMVVPIPAVLLDVFFVLNIALSVAVLMAAMNAQKPLDFSSFPSVLLFATLLRSPWWVSLGIASAMALARAVTGPGRLVPIVRPT